MDDQTRIHPFPLGQIIPRQTTPEVRHLFAQLGATMPYREASWVMKVFGFASGRSGRMAIWRHTNAAGRQIEGDQFTAIHGRADGLPIVRRLLIGIDDTYIATGERMRPGRSKSSAPNWRPNCRDLRLHSSHD